MSLYASFKKLSPYYHFDWLKHKGELFLDNPTNRTGKDFIQSYFEVGSKEKVLDVQFLHEYNQGGKHLHTASLYFLGVHLSCIVEHFLNQHFKQLIQDYGTWGQFSYTWFLTSLYHDVGSAVENDKVVEGTCEFFKSLNYHLGKNKVEYNPYQHILTCDPVDINSPDVLIMSDYFTYPETLINNYFFYRADCHHVVDHGILAGYLFFDKLKKNYDNAWKQRYQELEFEEHIGVRQPLDERDSYSGFRYKNLAWRSQHLIHFACVANSIMSHNIWLGKEKDKDNYKRYGLDGLLTSSAEKISIAKWPLLYFLGLMDTIEPVKRFSKINVRTIWENLDIQSGNGDITISLIGQELKKDTDEYDRWLSNIYSLPDWLKIVVEPLEKEDVEDRITLRPIIGD